MMMNSSVNKRGNRQTKSNTVNMNSSNHSVSNTNARNYRSKNGPTEKSVTNAEGVYSSAQLTGGKTVLAKKRNRSYWTGREHIKQIGPESPYVMIEKLPLLLTGQSEYKGHDCLKSTCPAKKNKQKNKSPLPPPRIEGLGGKLFPKITTAPTVNSLAFDTQPSFNIAGQPQLGQVISFQFWQTPLGNNVPVKSSYQKAKVVGYDGEYDLYEIELFNYDHPFIIAKDKSKSQRIAINTMVIDWKSLADASIISEFN